VTLITLVFEHSGHKQAIYTRHTASQPLVIGMYVIDLLITGRMDNDIDIFKQEMRERFWMSDLGLLPYYLGIEVCQNNNGITLCQSAYALKLLEKTGMKDCNLSQIPMEALLKLSKTSSDQAVDAIEYRNIVGALRYLIQIKQDLAHSVNYMSHFMKELHEDHQAAVKRTLRYIAGTCDHGIHYDNGRAGELLLLGYNNSDHPGDINGNKSASGILFYLGRNPITWQSQKKKSVALSLCVAEYMASSVEACQAIWLAGLLSEILGVPEKPPRLKADNRPTIDLIKNHVHHGRSKHIQITYHFVRECAAEGIIEVQFVGTNEQLADIPTKPVQRVKF
jgi:hypothetical protein